MSGSLYEKVGWEDWAFKASLDHLVLPKVKGENCNYSSISYVW